MDLPTGGDRIRAALNFPITGERGFDLDVIRSLRMGTVIGLISPDGYTIALKCKADTWTINGLEKAFTDEQILAAVRDKPGWEWHYIGWYNN